MTKKNPPWRVLVATGEMLSQYRVTCLDPYSQFGHRQEASEM